MSGSAGTFKAAGIIWERAWKCSEHSYRWYGDGVCRICGAKGEPEKLPDNATDVTLPPEAPPVATGPSGRGHRQS